MVSQRIQREKVFWMSWWKCPVLNEGTEEGMGRPGQGLLSIPEILVEL